MAQPATGSADVAQLVEHHLAKVRVAGSNPVVRSVVRLRANADPRKAARRPSAKLTPTAEWPSGLGKGLQSPVHGFDSRLRLTMFGGLRPPSPSLLSPRGGRPPPPPRVRAPAAPFPIPAAPGGGRPPVPPEAGSRPQNPRKRLPYPPERAC